MFHTSLDKLHLGYEQTLSYHAAYLSTVVTNTSLAMSTLCPGMLWQCIQQWEKIQIAERQASKQNACVAFVSNIALFTMAASMGTGPRSHSQMVTCACWGLRICRWCKRLGPLQYGTKQGIAGSADVLIILS